MRTSLGLVLVLLVGCKKSGAPEAGLELTYGGAEVTPAVVDAVNARLAALKVRGAASLEGEKLRVRVDPEQAEQVKQSLAVAGKLELFGVDDNFSKRLCPAPHPDEVALEQETMSDGTVTCFFTGPEAAVRSAASPVLGPQLRLQFLEGGKVRSFAVFLPAVLSGKNLSEVRVNSGGDPSAPGLLLSFDARGRTLLADATDKLMDLRLAIIVDGRVISAPVVRSRIENGQAMISTGKQAPLAPLMTALQAGELPSLTLERSNSY